MPELPCPHCGYDLSATPMNNGVRVCSECGRGVKRSEIVPGLSNSTWYVLHVWSVILGAAAMVGGFAIWVPSLDGLAWLWLLVAGWIAVAAVVYLAQGLLARSRGQRFAVGKAIAHSLARGLVMLPIAAVIATVVVVVYLLMNVHIGP